MESKYKTILKRSTVEPTENLQTRINMRVAELRDRRLKVRSLAYGASLFGSLATSLWAAIYLIQSVEQTGFWQYLKILLDPSGVGLSFTKEISVVLIESLPIMSVIALLAALGVFIWSVSNVFKSQNFISLKYS